MTLELINGHGEGNPERFVGRDQMATILGISVRKLDQLRADGEIPYVTWGIRCVRFRPSVVIARLAQRDVAVEGSRPNTREAA